MEQKRKQTKKVSNKGICRVKVSSFVALLSLSVETLLQKRIPWSRYAELADQVVLSNTGDAWACVKWCCRGNCCCATFMAIRLEMPRSG